MGLLQLYLRPGKQNVSLPNNIPKGSLTLRDVYASFNKENHGFYLATVQLPFVYTNNTQSNLSKRGLLVPLDHNTSTTFSNVNQRMGEVEIPRNFEVNVDLDNGHQIVLETDTQSGGTFDWNIHPSNHSAYDKNYYQGTPPAGAYISVGLNADKIVDGTTIPSTSGLIDGPVPFMYSMILTFEYEDGLIEQRLQQLIS